MRKLALIIVLALVLAPISALADVAKGDRGEEVRYLQWLLVNTGWLFEEPDGVFGGRTQQAVKDYQASKGYPQTGVADYALMEEIEADRARLDHQIYGNDYYEPYPGDYVPPFETGGGSDYVPPAHCVSVILPTMAWRDSCQRHLTLIERESDLCRFDDVERISEACQLWREDIREAFAQWIQEAPAQQRLSILSAWVSWNAAFEAQHEAMLALWPEGPAVQRQLTQMARNYAMALCELRSGEPATDPDIVLDGVAADFDSFCMEWIEATGTEFVSYCDLHAPAYSMEYDWVSQGAPENEGLSILAETWSGALNGAYDRWVNRCNESQSEAVNRARWTTHRAVEQLCGAFASAYALPDIAGVRVSQFEVSRLCEMVNAAMDG